MSTYTEAIRLLCIDRAAHDLEDAEHRKQPVPAMPELTAQHYEAADEVMEACQ